MTISQYENPDVYALYLAKLSNTLTMRRMTKNNRIRFKKQGLVLSSLTLFENMRKYIVHFDEYFEKANIEDNGKWTGTYGKTLLHPSQEYNRVSHDVQNAVQIMEGLKLSASDIKRACDVFSGEAFESMDNPVMHPKLCNNNDKHDTKYKEHIQDMVAWYVAMLARRGIKIIKQSDGCMVKRSFNYMENLDIEDVYLFLQLQLSSIKWHYMSVNSNEHDQYDDNVIASFDDEGMKPELDMYEIWEEKHDKYDVIQCELTDQDIACVSDENNNPFNCELNEVELLEVSNLQTACKVWFSWQTAHDKIDEKMKYMNETLRAWKRNNAYTLYDTPCIEGRKRPAKLVR